MDLIANTRMYGASERCRELWAGLVGHVSRESGVALEIVAHAAPAPIDALWERPDMGLVHMCGWPYWRSDPRPELVAAPVIDHEFCGGRALYWTDMAVRADDEADGIEDLFGRRLGWTVEHSHSGYNAPRWMLLPHFRKSGGALFSESRGPYVSPVGIINALLEDEIDIGPIDGYFHLLLQRHRPELASKIRTIAVSEPAPMPPFVASGGVSAGDLERLRDAALRAHLAPPAGKMMEELRIARFVLPEPGFYEATEAWSREAIASGYERPG